MNVAMEEEPKPVDQEEVDTRAAIVYIPAR
jgi:hypothetical protein